MMKKRRSIILSLIVTLFSGCLVSCQDEWNAHYDRNEELPKENLWEIIRSNESLSKFASIIEATGYDTLLSASQTYTVWAPENSALQQVDMNDKDELMRIMGNHVARYNNSTASTLDKGIQMLNLKRLMFENNGGLTFAGIPMSQIDILASNGILHTVSQIVPYYSNFYEFMRLDANYSSIYNSILSHTEQVLAPESTPTDLVYIDYNPLLESRIYGIGSVHDEDSVYTMIMPNNIAWEKAFNEISPWFKVPTTKSDSLQKVQTSLAILNSLVYRKLVKAPFSQYDSLISTQGTITHDVSALFSGTTYVKASNGNMYTTSSLNLNPLETWNPEIIIEAENEDNRTVSGTSSGFVRMVSQNDIFTDVSNFSYLEVVGTGNTASVSFKIPNTLSGPYDVIVDFVPPIIDGVEFETEAAQVKFELEYVAANGKLKTSAGKTTVVGGKDKVVANAYVPITLPVADYYDNLWEANPLHTAADRKINTTLTIYAQKTSKYAAKFRVDRIRFVPKN